MNRDIKGLDGTCLELLASVCLKLQMIDKKEYI